MILHCERSQESVIEQNGDTSEHLSSGLDLRLRIQRERGKYTLRRSSLFHSLCKAT
jgi:hypothetical protein